VKVAAFFGHKYFNMDKASTRHATFRQSPDAVIGTWRAGSPDLLERTTV
jgi:hypothetical protein